MRKAEITELESTGKGVEVGGGGRSFFFFFFHIFKGVFAYKVCIYSMAYPMRVSMA